LIIIQLNWKEEKIMHNFDEEKLLQDYNSKKSKLKELIIQCENYSSKINDLKSYKENLETKLEKSEGNEFKELKMKIKDINNSINKLKSTNQNCKENVERLHESIQSYENKIDEHINNIIISIIDEFKTQIERNRRIGRILKYDTRDLRIDPRVIKLKNLFEIRKVDFDLLYFIDLIHKSGLQIDEDVLKLVGKFFGKDFKIFPQFLINFILSYLKEVPHQSVLEPWANAGSMIIHFARNFEFSEAVALLESPQDKNLAKNINKSLNIEWELKNLEKDMLTKLRNEKHFYDIVLGFPPLSKDFEVIRFYAPASLSVRDLFQFTQMLRAAMLLKAEGVGIFLLRSSFLNKRNEYSAFHNLEKLGLYIVAVLDLPRQTFHPNSAIKSILLIIKRQKPADVFVGELTTDESYNEILLNNLIAQKEGKIPQLGALTNINTYYSFKTYKARRESIEIAKRSGLKPVKLNKISKEINFCNPRTSFEIKPNSVYLPFIESYNVVNSLDELQSRQDLYVQIVLDPDIAFSEYVSHFFNTNLGLKIRESFTDMTRILRKRLNEADIYIPDLNTQIEVINTNSLISDLSTQLDTYKHNLWKWPQKNKEIKTSVELFQVANRLDYWIDSLPFPLASILAACDGENDLDRRNKYLVNFFEAFSEFNAALILSAITSDKDFYINEFMHCINTDPNYKNWYYKPSFGSWNVLGRCLAAKIRDLLNDVEKRDICYKLFGNPNKEFMNAIINKNIYKILEDVKTYRNKWLGHGANVNEEENKKRFRLLVDNLSKIRKILSYVYEDSSIISAVPRTTDVDGGMYYITIKKIKGRGLSFKSDQIETTHPIERNKLYLYHENQHEALEILPFLSMRGTPKTEPNTCYFYNGFDGKEEGKEIRVISYHYDIKYEDYISIDELKSVFSIFNLENHISD